jgi:hypothetical protein
MCLSGLPEPTLLPEEARQALVSCVPGSRPSLCTQWFDTYGRCGIHVVIDAAENCSWHSVDLVTGETACFDGDGDCDKG